MADSELKASFSLPSILAVLAAAGSFMTGAFWGFLLALAAILLGVLGVILSFSSRVRGGVVSFFSLGAGLAGLIAAGVKALLWLTQ